jgi:hypothetical protein
VVPDRIGTPLRTQQFAPTILQTIGVSVHTLEVVCKEGTKVRTGIGLGNDGRLLSQVPTWAATCSRV